MGKRKASADQFAFTFDPPAPASTPAALAGADARVARTVAQALQDDGRDRAVIAAEMSVLLEEDVSKAMLDAYASPARDGHNISFSRMKALIAVTQRFDLLDRELRHIGAALLVGEEVALARVGHLEAQRRAIEAELRKLKTHTQPIRRGKD